MTLLRLALSGLVLISIACGSTQAALMLTLSAQPGPDLQALQPGQTVTFEINLSGVEAGDQIGFLDALVSFPTTVFGSASNVQPGPIVPDATGFLGEGLPPDRVSGTYSFFDATSATPITQNGVFYRFDVTVTGQGSGQVAFDRAAAINTNTTNPMQLMLNTGPGLNVRSVPEPSSLLLGGVVAGLLAASRWRGFGLLK